MHSSERCRCRIAVAGLIHSSLVATILSRSALVSPFGGTYPAMPVIFAAIRCDITLLEFPKGSTATLAYALAELSGISEINCRLPSIDLRLTPQNLIAPTHFCRLLQHCRNRAIFLLAKLDLVLHRALIQCTAQSIDDLQLRPNCRGLGGSLPRTDHFQRFHFLPLFLLD